MIKLIFNIFFSPGKIYGDVLTRKKYLPTVKNRELLYRYKKIPLSNQKQFMYCSLENFHRKGKSEFFSKA